MNQSKIIRKNANNKIIELSSTIKYKLEIQLNSLTQVPADLAVVLQNSQLPESDLKQILLELVKRNKSIFGLCTAYEPFGFNKQTHFFEPYFFRSNDSILYVDYTIQPENYFEKDWYKLPKLANSGVWIEPYADSTAQMSVMTTYSYPIYDKQNKIKGIIAADIFLNEFQKYLASFRVLENGYVFLFSKQKTILAHPNSKYIMLETMESLAKKLKQNELIKIADSIQSGKNGILAVNTIFNIRAAVVRYQTLSSGWGMVTVFSNTDLYEEEVDVRRKCVFFAIIGTFFFIFISIFFYFLILTKIKNKQRLELELIVQKRTFEVEKQKTILENQKASLTEQNEELNQLNEEISAQRDDLSILNDILEEHQMELYNQNNALEASSKRINESLSYAKRIQKAVLSSSIQSMNKSFDYFVLFRPREAVSGDFYWSKQVGKYSIIVIADCTGHGVPGAFLSMLGYAFLNDNVRTAELERPDLILNSIREMFKDSLTQTGELGEQRDGMDMSMVVIDNTTQLLYFAGANNKLYIVRENLIDNNIPKPSKIYQKDTVFLLELIGDRQPIGIYLKETPFSIQCFVLQNDDMVYLFTDGFTDQTGGQRGRKFGREQFRNILMDIHKQSLVQQKENVEILLENWQKVNDKQQVDDISVVGLRIHF